MKVADICKNVVKKSAWGVLILHIYACGDAELNKGKAIIQNPLPSPIHVITAPDYSGKLALKDLKCVNLKKAKEVARHRKTHSCDFRFYGIKVKSSKNEIKKKEILQGNNLLKQQTRTIAPVIHPVGVPETVLTGKHMLKKFGTDQHIPGSTVNCMAAGSDHVMWLGTDGGIAIYTGFSFSTLHAGNGLLHNYVQCLEPGEEGSMFAGTKGGLQKIFSGHIETILLPGPHGNTPEITSLKYDNGNLFAGTDSNLYIVNEKSSGLFYKTDRKVNDIIKPARQNTFYAATSGGLLEWQGDKPATVYNSFSDLNISALAEYKRGLLCGTQGKGLFYLVNDSLFQLSDELGLLSKTNIIQISVKGQTAYLSTFGKGIFVLNNNSLVSLFQEDAATPAYSNVVFPDNDGRFFAGCAGGLYVFDQGASYYHGQNGLASDIPVSVANGPDGRWWTGTVNGGITLLSDSTSGFLTPAQGLSHVNNIGITHTRSGKILLSTSGKGLDIIIGDKVYNLGKSCGLNMVNVNAAIEDDQGNIWIGTNENGLYKWDGTSLFNYNEKHGIKGNSVYGINQGNNGRVLIGTNGAGLMIIDRSGTIRQYNESNGLDGKVVYPVVETRKGIFAGTYGCGLFYIPPEGRAESVDIFGDEGISVLSMLAVGDEYLLCGTSKGLMVVDQQTRQLVNRLLKHEELLMDDFFPNALALQPDSGVLAAAVNNYLALLPLDRIITSNSPEPVICKLTLGDKLFFPNASDTSRLVPYAQNEAVMYTGYSGFYFRRNEIQAQGFLEGLENSWRNLDKAELQNGIKFRHLSPGKYRFHFRIKKTDGKWAAASAVSFEILPQWYRTTLAYVGYGLALILMMTGFSSLRNRQLIQKNIRLEQIVTDRTRKIVEQKEEIERSKIIVEEQNHQLTEKNHEIIQSITYARHLQEAILPPLDIINGHLKDNFLIYRPKDIVAGDFYWFEKGPGAEEEFLFFAVADCTGHGVPGAMVSVVCANALNRSLLEFGCTMPGEILDKTRELVIETFRKSSEQVKDGMDISLVRLHPATGELLWSGANNPLWVIKHNSQELTEIKADKQPVGNHFDQKPFLTHRLMLEEGDCFYLISDGYGDQFGGPQEKKFKTAQMKKLLLEICNFSCREQGSKMLEEFEAWKGDAEQVDDVSLWGIRFITT